MKLLNFGIFAAFAVSALALAQPDRGQNNKVSANRMKGRKMPVTHSKNGRKNGLKKFRKGPKPNKVRRNKLEKKNPKKVNQRNAVQKPKRFRKGQRKQYKARRPTLKSIPAKDRRQKRRSRTGNQATDDGYYYDQQYWYYPDYAYGTTGATPTYTYPNYITDSPIEQEPDDSSENCVPVTPTVQVKIWDDVATYQALPQLSAKDVEGIRKEAMTKTYGQTGRFLMEDGGTTSYEVKSHSLIVREICPGQGSDAVTDYNPEDYPQGRNGGKRAAKRRIGGKAKRRNRQRNGKQGQGNKQG